MAAGNPDHLTRLLVATAGGEAGAAERLLPLVYDELRALRNSGWQASARDTRSRPPRSSTKRLRLVGPSPEGGPEWSGRGHFYGAAAEAMRRILVEHVRARGRVKRGDGRQPVSLQSLASVELASECDVDDVLALDAAFGQLDRENPDAAAVVRLRFYAGLSVAETAKALGVSDRTVNREWNYARAWLYRALSGDRP